VKRNGPIIEIEVGHGVQAPHSRQCGIQCIARRLVSHLDPALARSAGKQSEARIIGITVDLPIDKAYAFASQPENFPV
jgi:hypothetical protein